MTRPSPDSGEDSDDRELEKALEQEQLAKLQGLSPEQVARLGHEAMMRLLVAKVAAGTASHQELAILRNMLRDNGMVWGFTPPPLDGQDAKRLSLPDITELPQLGKPDYE